MAPARSLSIGELAALRRLARVYRRLLLLAVPAALAGCQNTNDPLGPGAAAGADDTPVSSIELDTGAVAPASGSLAALTAPRIMFTSYRSGAGDIYRMDPAGNQVARITTSSDYEAAPAWSWDNKRIALVRPRKDNSDVLQSDIYIMNADGTQGHWARPYASSWPVTSPSWSLDGKRIAVVVAVQGNGYLGLIDVATGGITLIGGGIRGGDPSFDPTGKKIAYVAGFVSSLDQINADGTGHKVLLTGSGLGHPTWSPDGKRIAFNRQVNYDQEIYVKNLADGTVKRLTTSTGADMWPTWSPDGGKIAFSSFRSGKWQIWTMTSTGGSPTRITHTTNTEQMPAFSH
jgi:Tol biopolymer transport system component